MATVDPFLQPIPKALLQDKETRQFFEYTVRWMHDMWIRSGGGDDAIAPVVSDSNRKADTLLYAVLDKVSLGNPVTIDTTGFTIDTTHQFTDLTES
jgi:hypothetical protein